MHFLRPLSLGLVCLVAPLAAAAVPAINEIMFHPLSMLGAPEDAGQEWIELHNPSATAINLAGWELTKGADFTFPAGTVLAAGGYLVVAADVAKFQTAHPFFTGQLVGPWSGRLSSAGETIRLKDPAGQTVSEVTYADEGDWALRARGPLTFLHKGWAWESAADGGGRTIERRSVVLDGSSGQNWTVSTVDGGTPGAANAVASADLAPLIKNARHRPEIPRSTEEITVSCVVEDEAPGASATLHWRLDGGTWQTLPMTDMDGDGDVEATIPAQANLAVIEWYLEASDGTLSRTWPAPARTSDAGVVPETFDQVTNALIQVDNTFDPAAQFITAGNQPLYRLIMTAAERAELAQIGSVSGQQESVASMNATFISHDGTGIQTRYLCGVRNRGMGSALGPPNNYHVAFPSSDLWNDRSALGLNCRYGYAQALGAALMERAGIATQETAIVRVRVNGVNLAESTARMYGRYARIEGRDAAWAERHYPNDPNGNFYRLDDHAYPTNDIRSGEFRYEGEDATAYSDTFVKETNKDADNYRDLIEFSRIVSAPATGGTAAQPAIPNANYLTAVGSVLELDQFYRYFAADTLIGNSEGGFAAGRADDASLYRGILDPRFRLVPHDLDTVFDIGDTTGGQARSIFSYDGNNSPGTGVVGFARLFNHPQLAPRYYSAVLEALNTWFNRATIDPVIDSIMAGWVPATDGVPAVPNRGIAELKGFIDLRRAAVLGQIQQNFTMNVTVGGTNTVEGYRQTTTGAATFSGTFNVARTYSVTVNGQLAQWFYRPSGTDAAGTWKMIVPAGGGTVLRPGLNRVVVAFWDGIDGTGNVLRSFTADVFHGTAVTPVAGTLTPPGSLSLLAPASYVPGAPLLVRVDLKDALGNLDRSAWNRTATLSASNGVTISPSTVPLYNGMGSALLTVGATGSGGQTTLIARGGTFAAPVPGTPATWRFSDTVAAPAAGWQSVAGFDDAAWGSGIPKFGRGDNDERTQVLAPGTTRRAYYFRHKFNVSDPAAFTDLTLRILYDDGVAIYVNGTEVKRLNLIAAATHTTYSTASRSGTTESSVESYAIPKAALVAGENLIAVELHNDTTSGDIGFDLELLGNLPVPDPGSFTITASAGGSLIAQRSVTSLFGQAQTDVSGTLAGNTTWSGIVHVTGNVVVPAGVTLTIEPGTHVLIDGTSAAGDSSGAIITVNGRIQALGTAALPIHITAPDPAARWGQILFIGAQPSLFQHVLLSHAGHAPGVGHTGEGPMLRFNNASLTLEDSVLADGPAKAMYSAGTCDFVLRRSLITRMITGPELGDGCSLLVEDSNIQLILPDYRESNSTAPDDEDCLYVHNGAERPVVIRRSVFARCGDDVFDCLGGAITVEDSILREGWDKGMSLLNNDLTITRTLIVDCDKAIVPKSSVASTRTINVDRCTILSQNHNTALAPWGYAVAPSDPDPDTPSTGFYTQNKSGQSDAGATLAITAVNCIVQAQSPVLVDALYDPADTVVTYSDLLLETGAAFAWPGTGNGSADPLFVSLAAKDFRLQESSPARDAGNPAATDPDGSRADMGALPFTAASAASGTVTWTPAGGPYHITNDVTVPTGLTLVIQGGTSVYFDQNKKLTVNGGSLQVLGTPGAHVVFSHVPGTVAAGDCDPIKLGVQTGPPKWGGVRVYDNFATENVVRYADFINAQGNDPLTSENYGSLGFIRSWGFTEHLTFAGTHLRMLYGRNCKLAVLHCDFPDMFLFDTALARDENPSDFLASADNKQEQLKVEYPLTDPEVAGNAFYANGMPQGGWWRVYFNDFHGNKGHNDVFDADSGRWGQAGQFLLDCRYNTFHGITGDEHIDLGGDAYIASNVFERGAKDFWTSDTGYSNAISSGDKGAGTTIMVARNVFFDLDHAINCKLQTATIFEHNTVANLHADFHFEGATVTQDVKCAPINFFIPEDGANPSYGDGAYMGFNLVSNVPRLFSGADSRKVGGNVVNDVTTRIQFNFNLLDQIADPVIGANHAGGVFGGTFGPNVPGLPEFTNAAAKDFTLKTSSPALGTAPGGFDFGSTVPEWVYVADGPDVETGATSATFTVGGPGIVAYKWRLDGGSWSAPVTIGSGGVFPRTAATVRQAALTVTGLANGTHVLEVLGQDMAGNWQDSDPARTYSGVVQAAPTARTWTVNSALPLVRLSEIRAADPVLPDQIELRNLTTAPITLTNWFVTDDPTQPYKHSLSSFQIPASGYITAAFAGFGLDKDGDAVYLFENGVLRDFVTFGHQIAGSTIGRVGPQAAWTLCQPTLGTANIAQRLGESSAVRINEWLAQGEVLYDEDWIELANTGSLPVSLAGLHLTNNVAGNPAGHTFAPLSYIAAGGFVKLTADGDAALGATHLNFRLDEQQGEIALLAGTKLVDRVAFSPQTADYSMGRDASGAIVFFELPTGALTNGAADPAYANALAILRGLRVTELMFNPTGGGDFEFIELTNVGSTLIQLAGIELREAVDFTFAAQTLAQGQSLVLVSNLAKFRQRYGSGPVVAGQYSGKFDNSGEKLTLHLPPPFDADFMAFDYSSRWEQTADGRGKSLVITNPAASAGGWRDGDSWSASASVYGDPAGISIVAPDHWTAWRSYYGLTGTGDDGDFDGLPTVLEYALATNPNVVDGPVGLPTLARAADGHLELRFLLPENPGAAQGHGTADAVYRVEASDDLAAWTVIATKTFSAAWAGDAAVIIGSPSAGMFPIVVRDVAAGGPSRYLRLRATLGP